jgi:hypothetical protein
MKKQLIPAVVFLGICLVALFSFKPVAPVKITHKAALRPTGGYGTCIIESNKTNTLSITFTAPATNSPTSGTVSSGNPLDIDYTGASSSETITITVNSGTMPTNALLGGGTPVGITDQYGSISGNTIVFSDVDLSTLDETFDIFFDVNR